MSIHKGQDREEECDGRSVRRNDEECLTTPIFIARRGDFTLALQKSEGFRAKAPGVKP